MKPVTFKLRKEEEDEFLRTTSHTKEEIASLKSNFEKMTNPESESIGSITLDHFNRQLGLKENSEFAKFLFKKLDGNENGTLEFFEYMYQTDGLENPDFKERFKAYFRLFSDEHH